MLGGGGSVLSRVLVGFDLNWNGKSLGYSDLEGFKRTEVQN